MDNINTNKGITLDGLATPEPTGSNKRAVRARILKRLESAKYNDRVVRDTVFYDDGIDMAIRIVEEEME